MACRSALTAIAASLVLAAPAATATAHPAAAHRCNSADLRYPFTTGGPKTFGVFRLRIAAGRCTTAHRVARAWMKRFESNLRKGRIRLRGSVLGFTFTTLRPNAAQTYRLRGRRGATTIRFDYVVPNG